MNERNLKLLLIGALLMNLSFIIKHYMAVTDLADGLIKGAALGLMILSLIFTLKRRKQEMPLR